jgi:DNA-binding transcriptional regulator YiaG
MSQTEFARAFCINQTTFHEWEQGRGRPGATTRAYLAAIAKTETRSWKHWHHEVIEAGAFGRRR